MSHFVESALEVPLNPQECLITICARGGSKGVPGKNIRPLLGKPLIAHSIEAAQSWAPQVPILVSTDSREIADVAASFGAEVPFLRPAELATDSAGKIAALVHAHGQAEALWKREIKYVIDLDPTSPLRTSADLTHGWNHFHKTGAEVCFSVVHARKSPYFNMVERSSDGKVALIKMLPSGALMSRQAAPVSYELNASIYLYRREFFMRSPKSLWDGRCEMFEMPEESAFDIDTENDFIITECFMSRRKNLK